MLRNISIALAAAAFLSACSLGSRTVEKPVQDVRALLQANERALTLTHYLPSANHRTEHAPDGLVWHFMLNDRDYARMVISLRPRDGQSTSVSSSFEEVDDAIGPGIPFLRKTAKVASEEILTATIEGRPIDHAQLQEQIKAQAAKDPQALAATARGYMEVSAELYKEVQATGGAFSATSDSPARGSQPYDKKQPYDRTPAYDRN